MENIRQYLDATYLKTAQQAGLTENDNRAVVRGVVQEAIDEKFKLVMIRPDMVAMARAMVNDAGSAVHIGTVIDFPDGDGGLDAKMEEARTVIADGADDLDFVSDYKAYKAGDFKRVEEEVAKCTALGLSAGRVVKWIIETAALTDDEIKDICILIKNTVSAIADVEDYPNVFVKSSTGFYKTEAGVPNGATPDTVKIMLANALPLPVKAAGGVRSYDEAVAMIKLGVKRIGTSSAKAIAKGSPATDGY